MVRKVNLPDSLGAYLAPLVEGVVVQDLPEEAVDDSEDWA